MEEDYDRERSAALIREGKEITNELKVEIGKIRSQMDRVLDGREEDADECDVDTAPKASKEPGSSQPFWRFWH